MNTESKGRTPLHEAANNGQLDVVNRLLKAGADISALSDEGETAVHLAIWHNHADVANRLLEVSDERFRKLGDVDHFGLDDSTQSSENVGLVDWGTPSLWSGDRESRGYRFLIIG